ncbi:MAG: AHH domain-containing protein [Erythrobacter sp.]
MLDQGRAAFRQSIPFRSVNRPGTPGFDPRLQRHHLLPRQVMHRRSFSAMFTLIGPERLKFDDFRSNGLLLPATDQASLSTGMPLHRGPHRRYNEVVTERVGRIERQWSRARGYDPESALRTALWQLGLLQSALRRGLLAERRKFVLHARDPIGKDFDFTELDAMAEALWAKD